MSPRRSSLTLPPSAALPRDPSESPFSPRYFIAPRSPLRVLYLLVFSGFVFISNAASRMRNVRHVHARIYKCKCMYVFARIHMRKLNACGPFWRLCERRHACGAHPRHFSLGSPASFFPFEDPQLLDSRSRALKLRCQPNKLTRIARARFHSPLPVSRASDLPAATLKEKEKRK